MKIEIRDDLTIWANLIDMPSSRETPDQADERLTRVVNEALRDYLFRNMHDAVEDLPRTDVEMVEEKMEFTPKRLSALKAALEGKDKDAVIEFEGHPILVAYGRYLAEYLTGVFDKKREGK